MSWDELPTQDDSSPMPPVGVVMGPHPPCSNCGSQGFPADIEVSLKGREAWMCLDCYKKHMPPRIKEAFPVDETKVVALRQTPWSRSWRGWKQRGREDSDDQPTLILP